MSAAWKKIPEMEMEPSLNKYHIITLWMLQRMEDVKKKCNYRSF